MAYADKTHWRIDWFLSAVLNNHINEMVDRHSALLALRVDLFYRKGTLEYEQINHHQLERDIRALMEKMMHENAVVGYFWVLEYGEDRGYHAHVVFWLDRHITQRTYVYAQYAKSLWNEVTSMSGGLHRCEFKSNYSSNINIPVYYSNPTSVSNIRLVLRYLAKEEQKWSYPVYGCNEVPPHSGIGRPRGPDEWQYSRRSVRYSI